MGISGLLPLLKDIQETRPLSDFAGQTLAVDAYVWLHRGTYSCAYELATGKRTNKYVDYAMHRVRLLRHYNIEPYIVFDGGPLPAKKGTESERKARRDENIARANALAAQGKHSQAREYYVKCIDVTPQMAYQFIKALRAECVPYVVAPYEADAQLAYLERTGVVDGIITEDSDLLVFGCKTVLFKLDVAASTVTRVSRADFASITSGSSSGISLVGWSDVQFRAMAILSGCDYLPSIPGIGLKTAWSLLRKHKTVENVVRALNLEGKKKVPHKYLEAFRMAEKVFLYQRVYDPTQQRLVYLTEVPPHEILNNETEEYVGTNLEPTLAKQIAEGDACPISLLPMEDINPHYVPRALRTVSLNAANVSRPEKESAKGKCKISAKPPAGIKAFLTPKLEMVGAQRSILPKMAMAQTLTKDKMVVGRSSGKRTLAEVMDQELAAKRKKHEEPGRADQPATSARSKFFCTAPSSPGMRPTLAKPVAGPVAGPSRLSLPDGKENISCADENNDIPMEVPDPVQQEDGYVSPSPSMTRWDTPDVSSPPRPGVNNDDDFDADVLSSPPLPKSKAGPLLRGLPERRSLEAVGVGRGLSRVVSTPLEHGSNAVEDRPLGPDLRETLGEWEWDELTSEAGGSDTSQCSDASAPSSAGVITPDVSAEFGTNQVVIRDATVTTAEDVLEDLEDFEEDEGTEAMAARNERVASGWWEKWASQGPSARKSRPERALPTRRKTTMTPDGRHGPVRGASRSTTQLVPKGQVREDDHRPGGRGSLVFLEEGKTTAKATPQKPSSARAGASRYDTADGSERIARNRLAGYKWTGV